jgi:hypothetical protein
LKSFRGEPVLTLNVKRPIQGQEPKIIIEELVWGSRNTNPSHRRHWLPYMQVSNLKYIVRVLPNAVFINNYDHLSNIQPHFTAVVLYGVRSSV